MTIDILSDIHIDFYFRDIPLSKYLFSFFEPILTNNGSKNISDMLIIAGDIGHHNKQNIEMLTLMKELFSYKYIVCVLGNHDYYLIHSNKKYSNNSLNRAEEMRALINEQDGMYCLDGNVIEIDGIRIGGCDSWYDGKYIKKHFHKNNNQHMDNYIDTLWNKTMADAEYIHGLNWKTYAEEETEKLENIYKDVDIMVTHINPSIEKVHTEEIYREGETTGFFTFDGEKFVQNGTMQYWIYGHTHTKSEYTLHNVQCVCNPMGYPHESANGAVTEVRSIEIMSKKDMSKQIIFQMGH